jgi:hypothetical protein
LRWDVTVYDSVNPYQGRTENPAVSVLKDVCPSKMGAADAFET